MSASAVVNGDSLAIHSGEYVKHYLEKPISRVANLVERMALGPQTRVADFACGTGMLLHAMRPDQYATYDGIDFSSDFIEAAEAWAAQEKRTKYQFHCSDIRDFCAQNAGKYDVAATLDFSEHIDDALAIELYGAIRTSLKPGGKLYLHTPNLGFAMERAKQIGIVPQFPEHIAVRTGPHTSDILRQAGFCADFIRVTKIPHYNALRRVHPLSKLPIVGELFAARLWIEAAA